MIIVPQFERTFCNADVGDAILRPKSLSFLLQFWHPGLFAGRSRSKEFRWLSCGMGGGGTFKFMGKAFDGLICIIRTCFDFCDLNQTILSFNETFYNRKSPVHAFRVIVYVRNRVRTYTKCHIHDKLVKFLLGTNL